MVSVFSIWTCVSMTSRDQSKDRVRYSKCSMTWLEEFKYPCVHCRKEEERNCSQSFLPRKFIDSSQGSSVSGGDEAGRERHCHGRQKTNPTGQERSGQNRCPSE